MRSKIDAGEVLKKAIDASGLLSVVVSESTKNSVSLLCRQVGKEPELLKKIETFLHWENASKDSIPGLRLLVARRYVLKDGKMVFGWFVSVQADRVTDLQKATNRLAEFLAVAPKAASSTMSTSAKTGTKAQSSLALRVVSSTVDEDGKLHEIVEMPLAHQKKALNAPSAPRWSEQHGKYVGGGRGATHIG